MLGFESWSCGLLTSNISAAPETYILLQEMDRAYGQVYYYTKSTAYSSVN